MGAYLRGSVGSCSPGVQSSEKVYLERKARVSLQKGVTCGLRYRLYSEGDRELSEGLLGICCHFS